MRHFHLVQWYEITEVIWDSEDPATTAVYAFHGECYDVSVGDKLKIYGPFYLSDPSKVYVTQEMYDGA